LEDIGWTVLKFKEINKEPSSFFMDHYGVLSKVLFFWGFNDIIEKYINDILNNQ
jgi:hypothetical protein